MTQSSKGYSRTKPRAKVRDGADSRNSQFADADEASVQEHIEQRIAAGTQLVRIRPGKHLVHSLTTSSIHSETELCRVHATPEAHPDVI